VHKEVTGMTARDFFTLQVPEEWNRRLAEEEARGGDRVAKLRAAAFDMQVRVAGDEDGTGEEGGHFHLRVDEGRMSARPEAGPDPLVILTLGAPDFGRLAAEVGPSPMALLGGIGGDKDFVLTGARVEALRELRGTLRLEVTGDDPWGLLVHFGPDPVPEPATTIQIGSEEYRGIREGSLDLQGAFMTGKLMLDGDLEIAMKLAMAMMSPE
jgi:hypothetical protein